MNKLNIKTIGGKYKTGIIPVPELKSHIHIPMNPNIEERKA